MCLYAGPADHSANPDKQHDKPSVQYEPHRKLADEGLLPSLTGTPTADGKKQTAQPMPGGSPAAGGALFAGMRFNDDA